MSEITTEQLIAEAVRCEAYAKALRAAAALRNGAAPSGQPKRSIGASTAPANRGERIGQVENFLRKSGPKMRGDIVKATGMPVGSVKSVLANNRDKFERDSKNRWRIKEPKLRVRIAESEAA